ncbi:MAG: NAD-dependent epimerase/dehydratase family protein, partial [Hyphomicrobiaceae bacterium]
MSFETVAVTGGAGLLGSHVMQRLRGRCRLTAVDIKAPQASDAVLGDFVEASITDYAAMVRA